MVSVIVPARNDAVAVDDLVRNFVRDPRCEVLIVEADDDSIAVESRTHDGDPGRIVWMKAPAGRARQMNAGANAARGRWLLFLHADSRLPGGWIDEIALAEGEPQIVGGSFTFSLASERRVARWIERGVHWRVHWLGLPYGDQAIFVRRNIFLALGGYRELALMEDVDFVRRLHRRGTLLHSPLPVLTSARRWERDGWIRRSLENVVLLALFFLGCSPDRLARIYHRRQG